MREPRGFIPFGPVGRPVGQSDELAALGLLGGGGPMGKRNKAKRKMKGQHRGPNKAQKTTTATKYIIIAIL